MDAFVLMCPLSLCILRVFALSEYLCTPSERRTRNLVYFLNSLTGCRKAFFDNLRANRDDLLFLFYLHKTDSMISASSLLLSDWK